MTSLSPSRRPASWGLYLISDEAMLRDGSFPAFLEGALGAGLRVVQLRGKTLEDEDLAAVGSATRRLTRRFGADFILNDRLDLALRLEADGVHLGRGDATPEEARRILGPEGIIGLSTHSRSQILEAQSRPVDYIGVGPVFPTRTKTGADAVVGPELLRWAKTKSALPIVAIGGISLENLDQVLETGASSVAVISEIARSADPLDAAKAFLRRMEPSRQLRNF